MARAKKAKVVELTPWQAWCAERPGRVIPGYDADATAKPGMFFDREAAEEALGFIRLCCTHVEGPLAGQPIEPGPWQDAFVGALFGWKRSDGTRRYHKTLVMVPRKNAKTTTAAACGLYVMTRPQPKKGRKIHPMQCYAAAGNAEQAGMIYRAMAGMVTQKPALSKRLEVIGNATGSSHTTKLIRSLVHPMTSMKVISSDGKTKHGGNPAFVIIDELHSHQNRELCDALETGVASQLEPLVIMMSTMDHEGESVCNEKHKYGCAVRDGKVDAPEFLPVIWEAPEEADWKDPAVWALANPGYPVSPTEVYMQSACNEAQVIPGKEGEFRRLHLNQKTKQETRWLPAVLWAGCRDERPKVEVDRGLLGRPAYGGLDLSATGDLTALVLLFPGAGPRGEHVVRRRLWIATDNGHQAEKRDGVPYVTWRNRGLIEFMPGSGIDQEKIKDGVREEAERYVLKKVGFDPWHSELLANELLNHEPRVKMVKFGQSFSNFNQPTCAFENMLKKKELLHEGDGPMEWMFGNLALESSKGLVKPSKANPKQRIDGMVGLIMCIGLMLADNGVEEESDTLESGAVATVGR